MKLMVTGHISASALEPTHHNFMHALDGFPKGNIGWYGTHVDVTHAQMLFGPTRNDPDGRSRRLYIPDGILGYMGAQLLWEVVQNKPEVVLVINGHLLEEAVRTINQYTQVFLWSVDDPHELSHSQAFARHCTAAFTTEPTVMHKLGESYLLPHAVLGEETDYYRKAAEMSRMPPVDVLFLGSMFYNRLEWLNRMAPLLAERDLSVRMISPLTPQQREDLHPFWSTRATYEHTTWADTQLLYGKARCVINIHRACDSSQNASNLGHKEAHSLNQSVFTVPAVGGVVLCDGSRKAGLLSQFEVNGGCCIPNFETPEEMAEAVIEIADGKRYYIEMCDEARRVIKERHLWKEHRIPVLVEALQKHGVDLTC
jgi:hypothetical protein